MEEITKYMRTILLAIIAVVCFVTWLWLADTGIQSMTGWSALKSQIAVLVLTTISILSFVSFIGDARNEI